MERPEAKRVIVIVAGAFVIAAAIISAPPERPPGVDPSRVSGGTSTTSATTASGGSETGGAGPAEETSIQLNLPIGPAERFQAVPIRGTHRGGANSLLQVQRREGERWVSFPVPTMTDQSGKFATHVELGKRGRYWLRVLDPRSGATSEAFPLVIKD